MKDVKLLMLVFILAFLPSCKSTQLKKNVYVDRYYTPTASVDVFQIGQELPKSIIRIGSVTVGEAGLTKTSDCTYEACLNAVKLEAKSAGADIVYIVSVQEPNGWSSCYSITAELYKYKIN